MKNCHAKLKSGQNYYGKLQVDKISGEIKLKTNQNKCSPPEVFYKKLFGKSSDWVLRDL